MKIVLLSGYDPTARYLHGHLSQRHEVRLLRVVWPPPAPIRRSLAQRVDALLDPGRVVRRLTRLDVDAHYRRLHARLEAELSGREIIDGRDSAHRAPTLPAGAFKGATAPAALAELARDVLLVDGAPMLGRAVLEVPRLATINLHFGIAPEYRGSHTLFWAMYLRDWDHVGATLHHVTPALDGGAVLARLYPELRPGDDEAAIMARCTSMAATVLDELLGSLAGGRAVGAAQVAGGRMFRSRDRDAWRDRVLRARLALGDGPPARAARVESYFGAPGGP
jgi:hypothetical protein